jgi:hypothetical protein
MSRASILYLAPRKCRTKVHFDTTHLVNTVHRSPIECKVSDRSHTVHLLSIVRHACIKAFWGERKIWPDNIAHGTLPASSPKFRSHPQLIPKIIAGLLQCSSPNRSVVAAFAFPTSPPFVFPPHRHLPHQPIIAPPPGSGPAALAVESMQLRRGKLSSGPPWPLAV